MPILQHQEPGPDFLRKQPNPLEQRDLIKRSSVCGSRTCIIYFPLEAHTQSQRHPFFLEYLIFFLASFNSSPTILLMLPAESLTFPITLTLILFSVCYTGL